MRTRPFSRAWVPAVCLFMTFRAVPAASQSAQCPVALENAADAMVDTIKTWRDVETTYRKYRLCDDGSIAEGNAAAIAHVLTEKWATLPQLVSLTQHETGLKSFVIAHVNDTLDGRQLEKIHDLASTSCPQGAEAMCKSLAAATARP